MSNCSLPLETA